MPKPNVALRPSALTFAAATTPASDPPAVHCAEPHEAISSIAGGIVMDASGGNAASLYVSVKPRPISERSSGAGPPG